jgi:hypothetical protein
MLMIVQLNVKMEQASVTLFLVSALAKTRRQLMRFVIKTVELMHQKLE